MASFSNHATPNDLPPELHLEVFKLIDSPNALQSYLLVSRRATAVFFEYETEILRQLLTKNLNEAAMRTGLKIHHLELNRHLARVEDLGQLPESFQGLQDLDLSSLRGLYRLCLRHEAFVEDAMSQEWVKRQPNREKDEWGMPYWLCAMATFLGLEDVASDKFIAAAMPKRLYNGFFALELCLRAMKHAPPGRLASTPTLSATIYEYFVYRSWEEESTDDAHDIITKDCAIVDVILVATVLDGHWFDVRKSMERMALSNLRRQDALLKGEGILLHTKGPIMQRYTDLLFSCVLSGPDSLSQEYHFRELFGECADQCVPREDVEGFYL